MARRGRRTDKTGRSDGEARHVRMDYWIMETDAWLLLSSNAKVLLQIIAKRYNGRNNGTIAFGVRSGVYYPINGKDLGEKPFGLSRFQIGRALTEAEAAGFIVCTLDASFGQKRLMREWRLTWLEAGGKPATRDFVTKRTHQNSERRSTGAPKGALQEHQCTYPTPEVPEMVPYRSASAPMDQSHRSTSAHHLVNQGVGGNIIPLPARDTTADRPHASANPVPSSAFSAEANAQ